MTANELKAIETELQKRGYKKLTVTLTSQEDYGWFKTFGDKDNDYQIEFRVWDWTKYRNHNLAPYGFDVWVSPLGTESRMVTSNWEPICDIDTFERMAAEFNQMARKFINPEK